MDGTPCDAIKFNACTLTNLVTQLFMKAESHTMYIQALLYESMYVFSDFFVCLPQLSKYLMLFELLSHRNPIRAGNGGTCNADSRNPRQAG